MSLTRVRAELCLFLLAVAATFTAVAWPNRAPTIFADEAGYLGNARWLADGPLWPMGKAANAALGYPLLLAPAFALFDAPSRIYRIAMLTNVLLVVGMAALLYVLVRRGLGGSSGTALAAATIGVAYPAVAVQVGIAWVEITSMVAVTAFLLTVVLASRHLTPWLVVTHGLLSAYLFSLHGRFTALPLLTLAGLGVLVVRRPSVRWWATGTSGAVIALVLLIRHATHAVNADRWEQVRQPSISLGSLRSVPLLAEVRSLTGQLWYLLAGTAGVALLGLVVLVIVVSTNQRSQVTGQPPEDSRAGESAGGWVLATYLLIAVTSIIAISVSYMALGLTESPRTGRSDHLYYGRYNECLVPTLLAAGIHAALQRRWRRAVAAVLAFAAVLGPALLMISLAVRGDLPFSGRVQPVMLSALEPLFGANEREVVSSTTFVVLPAIVASLLGLVLAGAALRQRLVVPVVLLLAFGLVSMDNHERIGRSHDLASTQLRVYDRLRALHPQTVAYDPVSITTRGFYATPFWLAPATLVPFDGATAQWPPADLYVGPMKWPAAANRGLRLIAVDTFSRSSYYAASTTLPGATGG